MTNEAIKIENNQISIERHLENIDILGYTILENVISKEECDKISDKLDYLDEWQNKEFGLERLQVRGEFGVIRAPLYIDDYFTLVAENEIVLNFIKNIIGKATILNQQNGLVLRPNVKHSQTRLHRDINFANYSGKPIALNAFWFIDDFTAENGATWILPYSHNMLEYPSEDFMTKNMIQMIAKRRSVAIFDSRLLHKAGFNTTDKKRRALNHIYTKPHIKQQIDLTVLMEGKYNIESSTSQLLGFWANPPKSIHGFRSDVRTYRSGQV